MPITSLSASLECNYYLQHELSKNYLTRFSTARLRVSIALFEARRDDFADIARLEIANVPLDNDLREIAIEFRVNDRILTEVLPTILALETGPTARQYWEERREEELAIQLRLQASRCAVVFQIYGTYCGTCQRCTASQRH